MNEIIYEIQSKIKSKIFLDYDMGKSTWFRTGGKARGYVIANSLKDQDCENANYCSVDIKYLENHLNKNLYTNFKEWRNIKNGVYRSPLVVYEFLSAHKNDFELFLVKYRGRYNHLYALKKNSTISKNDFINALNLSFSEKGKLSYLEMIQM